MKIYANEKNAIIYFPRRKNPTRAYTASMFMNFLNHTQLDTHTHTHTHIHIHTHTHTVGLLWMNDQLVAVATTNTTHNTHRRRTSMSSAGFEPSIPAIKRLSLYLRAHGH